MSAKMPLPPMIKDLDTADIVIKKAIKCKYGVMYQLAKNNGKDIMFYFGRASTVFGADQDADPDKKKDPSAIIDADKKWAFSVQMGWENARTDLENARAQKLEEICATVAKALAALPEDEQIVNEENEPLTEEQLLQLITKPIVMKRSKTKKRDNPNKPGKQEFVPYEPTMKWVIPFGFKQEGKINVRDNTRVLEKFGFVPFKDEDDQPIEPTVQNAKVAVPPRSEVEIWGRLTQVHVGDIGDRRAANLRFETLMIKRTAVDEARLGQEIDTSRDYEEYYAEMQRANDEATPRDDSA